MLWNVIFKLKQYSFQNISILMNTTTIDIKLNRSIRFVTKFLVNKRFIYSQKN